ncbi:GNAT family N-acetyltransferase [Xylanimonas oleitrophica]|uniref:GNAT family N-acetyltransferase n=1 Tax=Xylanimonas oleitrophica TaxID=2607479 RepID=UPI0015CF8455|nr:GNAT family N-acetyltransferase [Xylanimonas oleitrophica]
MSAISPQPPVVPRRPARVRLADAADAVAIADVHVRSYEEAYSSLLSAEVIARHAQTARPRWSERLSDARGDHYWLAERSGQVVGFSWAQATGARAVRPLELVGLYVLAAEYGTGTADVLLEAAVGDAPCFLWVAEGNARAQAFYRRHGFEPDGAVDVLGEGDDTTTLRMVR